MSGGGGVEVPLDKDWAEMSAKERQAIKAHFAHHAVEETLDIDWQATPYNRIAMMNYLAQRLGPGIDYLEVGCDHNLLFASLPLASKTGIDPVRGGTHRMTSDVFFAANDNNFDLIFLDGLHTYEQLHRDVANALKRIRSGGFIGIHDLVPRTWMEEHVPRIDGIWTGDVWKVGLELAATPGLAFRLIMIAHGVDLIHATPGGVRELRDMSDTLTDMSFADFHTQFEGLPKLDWPNGLDWVEACLQGAPERDIAARDR